MSESNGHAPGNGVPTPSANGKLVDFPDGGIDLWTTAGPPHKICGFFRLEGSDEMIYTVERKRVFVGKAEVYTVVPTIPANGDPNDPKSWKYTHAGTLAIEPTMVGFKAEETAAHKQINFTLPAFYMAGDALRSHDASQNPAWQLSRLIAENRDRPRSDIHGWLLEYENAAKRPAEEHAASGIRGCYGF